MKNAFRYYLQPESIFFMLYGDRAEKTCNVVI